MRTSCQASIWIVLLAIWASFCGKSAGQTTKADLDYVLKKAKDEFQAKISEIEVKLILALEQRIESARKVGDKIAVDRTQAERDKFKRDGTLPTSVEKATQIYQRQLTAARAKLEQVYRNQIKEHVKSANDAQASALRSEMEAFLADELSNLSQDELIRNGGSDEDLNLSKKPSWITTQGKWQSHTNEITPQAGSGCFGPGNSPQAELVQEIDVDQFAKRIDDGLLKFEFKGYVRSWPQLNPDTTRIVIEFLESRKKKPLEVFDSGEIASENGWQLVTDSRVGIKGTRCIRIRLQSKRNSGDANDGYYDSLSLKVMPAK